MYGGCHWYWSNRYRQERFEQGEGHYPRCRLTCFGEKNEDCGGCLGGTMNVYRLRKEPMPAATLISPNDDHLTFLDIKILSLTKDSKLLYIFCLHTNLRELLIMLYDERKHGEKEIGRVRGDMYDERGYFDGWDILPRRTENGEIEVEIYFSKRDFVDKSNHAIKMICKFGSNGKDFTYRTNHFTSKDGFAALYTAGTAVAVTKDGHLIVAGGTGHPVCHKGERIAKSRLWCKCEWTDDTNIRIIERGTLPGARSKSGKFVAIDTNGDELMLLGVNYGRFGCWKMSTVYESGKTQVKKIVTAEDDWIFDIDDTIKEAYLGRNKDSFIIEKGFYRGSVIAQLDLASGLGIEMCGSPDAYGKRGPSTRQKILIHSIGDDNIDARFVTLKDDSIYMRSVQLHIGPSWNVIRLIWIGYLKNKKNKKCRLQSLPKDIIKKILSLLEVDCHSRRIYVPMIQGIASLHDI